MKKKHPPSRPVASGKHARSRPVKYRPQPGDPRYGRSILSNHEGLLPDVVDGRSSAARRFRNLVSAFVQDQGGIDNCSEIKRNLLRRLAATTVQAEMLEARLVNGEPINVAELCALASTALRLSTRLGIERVPKPVETLADYLARAYPQEPEAGESDEEDDSDD